MSTSNDVSESWLLAANERYRQQDIPPIGRVFKALSELSIERGHPIAMDSPLANKMFDWFKANTQQGAHALGAMFTGSFYYDACYWPVTIPIGFGTFSVDPFKALETMPAPVKISLGKDPAITNKFLVYWVNCFDYGYGFDEIVDTLDPQAKAFLENGNLELKGAVAQLHTPRPNLKSILNFRMACEIFLKAFLIQKKKLSEKDLKKLSHGIAGCAKECFAVVPLTEFQTIETGSSIFPDVSARYDGPERKPSEVADAAFLAQLTAATVTRALGGRDSRSQIPLTQ